MGILKKLFGQKSEAEKVVPEKVENPVDNGKEQMANEPVVAEKEQANEVPAEEATKSEMDAELAKKLAMSAQKAHEETVQLVDPYGRPMRMPKSQWVEKILPAQIKASWDKPEALYNAILVAMQNRVAAEVEEAAVHLHEIDPIKERGCTMLAVVYMRLEKYTEAEAILQDFIKESGKTGAVMTNLAKIYHEQGDKEKAKATLWEALELDPNQTGSVLWWAALQGQDNRMEAFKAVSEIEGSWLAKIYLAKEYLGQKDLDAAKALYVEVLVKYPDNSQAMMNISGDLGQAGYINEIIEMIEPRFVFGKHDLRIALNLLQAYIQTKNLAQGQALLSQLMRLERPELKERLLAASDSLEAIRRENFVPVRPEQVEIEMVAFTQPIWFYGLDAPTFLQPQVERTQKVAILPYAATSKAERPVGTTEREDELGSLTRTIPLYLEEVFAFTTAYEPQVIMPIAKGLGPTITSKGYTPESLLEMAENLKVDLVIAGTIEQVENNAYNVTTMIYEAKTEEVTTIDQSLTQEAFGPSFNNMIEKIQEIVDLPITEESSFYHLPLEAKEVKPYLTSLGQALMQTIIMNSHVSKDALWGERNMMNWYINLCLAFPNDEVPKIMLASTLIRSRAYGSDVYLEFRQQALHVLNSGKESKQFLPLIYRLYGMKQEYDTSKAEQLEQTTNEAYKMWMEKI